MTTTTVTLSAEAVRVLCGLVAGSLVDADTITADPAVWEELRSAFPLAGYSDSRPED